MRDVARVLSEGLRRVVSAPVVLVAIAAASLLFPLYPRAAAPRALAEYAIVASFLLGGIIDRYARERPTRAHGFFGACGRHAGAMLRLTAIEGALVLALYEWFGWPAAAGGAVAIAIPMTFARVRIVVEDRRSAIGALAGGVRFVARNPAAWAVVLVWMTAIAVTALYARGAGPIVALPLVASATVLFQSRLAHARYTAAPPVEWPESPAAEAIANRRGPTA